MDYSIKLKNDQVLKGLITSPGENMRAMILFVHGLGEHIQRYPGWADLLIHDRISVSLFHSVMSAAGGSLANAAELKVPLLFMHGSDDMICSPDGSREFASLTGMAELKIWEGGYHELHNEIFKKDVFEYIINWINTRLN